MYHENQINYGELIVEFVKSLPQVSGSWKNEILEIEITEDKRKLYYDFFRDGWTYISIGNIVEYTVFDNTDLNSNLREIYTIIEANKEDIIKTFTENKSARIAELRERIDKLNNELKELENGKDSNR